MRKVTNPMGRIILESPSFETQEKMFNEFKKIAYANVDKNGQISFTVNTPGRGKGKKTRYTLTRDFMLVRMSPGNNKIIIQALQYNIKVGVFDLLAGHTCPAARACLRKTVLINGDLTKRIVENHYTDYACFAVKAESQYIWTFIYRLINTLFIKFASQTEIEEVLGQLYSNFDMVRVHGSGDFFKVKYYNAVKTIATESNNINIYAYSKMLPFVMDAVHSYLDNFGLVYSDGGTYDDKVDENTPVCVVNYPGQDIDLPLACQDKEDDFTHILAGKSFSLKLH